MYTHRRRKPFWFTCVSQIDRVYGTLATFTPLRYAWGQYYAQQAAAARTPTVNTSSLRPCRVRYVCGGAGCDTRVVVLGIPVYMARILRIGQE